MQLHIDPRRGCPFPAGSVEKIRYLRERARRGLPLFLAADNAARISRVDPPQRMRARHTRRQSAALRRMVGEMLAAGLTARAIARRAHVSCGHVRRLVAHAREQREP